MSSSITCSASGAGAARRAWTEWNRLDATVDPKVKDKAIADAPRFRAYFSEIAAGARADLEEEEEG